MKEINGASIILTEECNLDCTYCYEKRKSPKVMSLETGKAALKFLDDNYAGNGKRSITWFGGEPMLNFNVLRELSPLVPKDVDQLVVTNCTVWSPYIFRFFETHPHVRIQLSWDGMPEFQDSQRGQSYLVEENIKDMLKLTNHLTAHVQVTPAMVPKLMENTDYIAGIMKHRFRIVYRPITEMPGWTQELAEQLQATLTECYIKYGDAVEKVANCEHSIENVGTCGAGKNFASIAPNGDIYACHRFYFSKNRDFKVGTLENGFDNNLKTELLEEYTVENIIGCTECAAFEICDRCIAANASESDEILMPTEQNCMVQKAVFFSLFNYIKVYRPWLTNIDPPFISMPIKLKRRSTAQDLLDVIHPILGQLATDVYYLKESLRRVSMKQEHDSKNRR